MKRLLLTLIALVSLSILPGCGYNQIQTLDENVSSNWAQVESQLQRRADLIPNLVNVVKRYARHEETVFTDIADARARMSGALQQNDPGAAANATGELNSALSRLLVVVESYPQLKADQQFTRLMDELAGTENRIQVARMDYNNSVRDYNAYIRRFPTNITAAVTNAKPRKYYNPPASSQQVPVVDME